MEERETWAEAEEVRASQRETRVAEEGWWWKEVIPRGTGGGCYGNSV